jgi:hypothetical protein
MLECSILLAYRMATAAVNIANTIKTNATIKAISQKHLGFCSQLKQAAILIMQPTFQTDTNNLKTKYN